MHLAWQDYLQSDQTRRSLWIDDLRKAEAGTDVTVLSTRISTPGDHLLIRPGQRASTVVTCLKPDKKLDWEYSDTRRKLLSISFDTLSDWHIVLQPETMTLFNNRVSGDSRIRADIPHAELPPDMLGRRLGVERGFTVSPDFQDVSDRMLSKIDLLKRTLVGDPDCPRLEDITVIDDILNAVIFLRFLEDYTNATGDVTVNLREMISSNTAWTFGRLFSEVLKQLDLDFPYGLFRKTRIESIGRDIGQYVLDWLSSSYQDDKQGRYEYDMSLIAEYSIGQIYDKYISLVSYHTQNGTRDLFPEYDSELSWQRGTGLLYTPEYMARFLVRQALRNFPKRRWRELKIGDMACGSAVFLRNYLLSLHGEQDEAGVIDESVMQNLEAIDVNPSAVAAARLSIAMTGFKCTGGLTPGFDPKVQDALSPRMARRLSDRKLDLVLMNPPFKGYELQSDSERSAVSTVLHDYASGRTDYSLAFLKLAYDRLEDGGCIGIVMPSAFLDSRYAHKIRKLLAENGEIQLVAKFEDYSLFSRGQTQVALIVFRKHLGVHSAARTRVLYCRTNPESAVRAVDTEIYDTRFEWEFFKADSSRWDSEWVLLPEQLQEVLNRLENLHPKLQELFEVRQGIRFGHKRAFLIDDLHSIPKNERRILRPVADDENIYDWRIQTDNRRLLYAYTKGQLTSREDMTRNYPTLLDRLEGFGERLQTRARMQGEPIWALAWPRDPKLMFGKKLVSTQFGLEGRFAFDEKGTYAVTNGNILVPKEPIVDEQAWLYYLSVLNSKLFARLLARRSNRLRGGQYSLDGKYVKHIPIPRYEEVDPEIKRKLVHIGKQAHMGHLIDIDFSDYESSMLQAYKLSEEDYSII